MYEKPKSVASTIPPYPHFFIITFFLEIVIIFEIFYKIFSLEK
jgi:hypothetical protein